MSTSRLLASLALAGVLTPTAAPTFAQTLDIVSLTAEKGTFGGDPDWFLNVGVEGSTDITSASVTPPGRAAIPLDCTDQGPSSSATSRIWASLRSPNSWQPTPPAPGRWS